VPADRAWHTVLIGGMREGSAFEGTSGAAPADSLGSYYALDITQPDQLTTDTNGKPLTVIPGTDKAPLCLDASDASFDATCGKDAADPAVRGNQLPREWPTVLWEITDTGDLEVGVTGAPGAGFIDMGESWSKPALGRVRICTANCGQSEAPFPVNEDHYVAIFGGGFDRERLNRRGNWLYMVDVETGKVLYRANSSCGINAGSGCSPIYFASIPSEPAAIDGNGDGYIDVLYVGDLKGRMWRVDLTDLRFLSSPPSGRFDNKIDVDAGSGKPFLFFEAPQPTAPATHPFYPIYYRPSIITLGYSIGGKPAIGVAFGTGDRDDITSSLEPLGLTYKQRFYYVIDTNNNSTRVESDLLDIASPTAASATTAPVNGWFLELNLGERINADSLTVGSVIFFTTFNPLAALSPGNPCAQNTPECGLAAGTARLYRVFYNTGNPYLGSDRGETQTQGGFLSEPVYFQSKDQEGNLIYTTENTVKKESAPGGKKTTVKSWKERARRP
jgi:Tfp pilus tip-associated adhesin PilY1